MQERTNWYWDQHQQQQVITVTTCTILHILLDIISIKYIHDIPKTVCNRTQAKIAISRHPMCLTDSDYDFILE